MMGFAKSVAVAADERIREKGRKRLSQGERTNSATRIKETKAGEGVVAAATADGPVHRTNGWEEEPLQVEVDSGVRKRLPGRSFAIDSDNVCKSY